MRLLHPSKRNFRLLAVLAIAQIAGWGTVGLPAVAGSAMAAGLQLSLPVIFAGTSVLYVLMGLCGPVLGPVFTRFGARRIMISGSMLAAPGFVVLGFSQGPVAYFAAWAVLGAAGAATLSTAAYIYLNEVLGRQAKSAISALMLMTGLSSSIFWPLTAFLVEHLGWRSSCLIFAGVMVFVCLPLYSLGLPARSSGDGLLEPVVPAIGRSAVGGATFYLVASAIALNAFVTYGLSAILIELFKARGLTLAQAVGLGSTLGVIQVLARGLDFMGGGRWDGITTAIVAGAALPLAMVLLIAGGEGYAALVAFVVLYGLASGALAVARATIPLVFYDKGDYARAASRIALPLNLLSASSPPILAALLSRFNGNAVLALTAICSTMALAILILLRSRRPLAPAAAERHQGV